MLEKSMGIFSSPKKWLNGLLLLLMLAPLMVWADPYDDFVKKGRDHFGLFQYKEAKACFEKAVALDSSRYDAHYQLGMTLRKMNDLQGALASFEKALKAGSEELDAAKAVNAIYVQLAKEQRSAGNREQMLTYLNKACMAYPQNTQNWAGLLNELATDKKWDDITAKGNAIRNANQEALEAGEDKNLQRALILVAMAYKEKQDPGKARDYLKAATRIHNADEDLIRLQNELGQQATVVASSMFEEGKALYEKGNFKAAIEKLEKAASAEPSNGEISDLLATAQKKLQISDFTKAANEYEAKGKYAEALEKMEKALSFADDDATLQKRVASLTEYIEKVENKKAADKRKKDKDALAKRLAEEAKNSKFKDLLESAKKNEQKQLYEFAIKDLEEALKVTPDNSSISGDIDRLKKLEENFKVAHEQFLKDMSSAEKAIDGGNYSQAYDTLKKMAADTNLKEETQILPKLLDACLALEKNDEVEKYATQLSRIATDAIEVAYFQGYLAYQRGDYDIAGPLLDKVAEKNKNFKPDVRKMQNMIRLNKWKGPLIFLVIVVLWVGSGTVYKQIVKFSKGNLDSKIEKMLQAGDYANVIPLIQKRLEDNEYLPNRRALTVSLGEAFLRTGRHEEAKARAVEILQKDSKNAPAQRILGEAFFQMRDNTPEGVEKIQALFKLDESRKDVLAYLVTHYKSEQADSKTALEILHKQIAVAPEDEDTLVYLAEFYSKRATFNATTLKVFERASRLDPDRPEFLNGNAQCLLQTGKKEEAGKLMQQGRERWPGHELFRGAGGPKTSTANRAAADPKTSSTVGAARQESAGTQKALPTRSVQLSSAKVAPKGDAPSAGDGIKCASCGAMNNGREYYCTKCGKPLK